MNALASEYSLLVHKWQHLDLEGVPSATEAAGQIPKMGEPSQHAQFSTVTYCFLFALVTPLQLTLALPATTSFTRSYIQLISPIFLAYMNRSLNCLDAAAHLDFMGMVTSVKVGNFFCDMKNYHYIVICDINNTTTF